MYVCMYVCTVLYACVYVYIYVSQRDFRLMSFTAGRCGTPLIPNDQLRRNGVRSSDLIVCMSKSVSPVHPDRKPIATNPDRRTSEASPPASDRKHFTNRTALVVRYCFNPATTSDVVHGSEVLKLDCVRKCVSKSRPVHFCRTTIACTPCRPILICC